MPKGTVKSLERVVLAGSEVCAPPQALTLQTLQETLTDLACKQNEVDSRITTILNYLEEASALLFGSEPTAESVGNGDEKSVQAEGAVARLNQLAASLVRRENENNRRLEVVGSVVKRLFHRLDIGFGCEGEAA